MSPVTIHFIDPLSAVDDEAEFLTESELQRASRFHYPHDRRHWIACRVRLRKILASSIGLQPREVPIVISPNGKPLLAPPFDHLHFNLTHCPDLGLAVVGTLGPVGIDIEKTSRANELLGCESGFGHPGEIAALPTADASRAMALLSIWTAKEAFLKALGTGFSHPPESVRVRFHADHATATSDLPLEAAESQAIFLLDHPKLVGYVAAVSRPVGQNFGSVDRAGVIWHH